MTCASRSVLTGVVGLRELPKPHLPEAGLGLVRVLAGGRRATARRLHVGLDHIELAVAELGHGMHVGVGIDPHAGRDRRNDRFGPIVKVAATGAGFSSMTIVNALTRRASPGGRVARTVTGTIAASSARPGISIASRSVPSASGRPLKPDLARSGHGSCGLRRRRSSPMPPGRALRHRQGRANGCS